MKPVHAGRGVAIFHADCKDVMARFRENSVDAIVTDPPYDLLSTSRGGSGRSNEPDNPHGRHGSRGGGFMGLAWDATGVAFDPKTWGILGRTMKPGAHLVAFGGERTYHRLACAVEDAGFEVRFMLLWLHGQGFPKSLDVGKAMDRAAGAKRAVLGQGPFASRRPMADHDKQGITFADDSYVRPAGHVITSPATNAASQWDGWGTALKPAATPILLARKPLSEPTVAANVLRWGTGALNIDGCRIIWDGDAPSIGTPGWGGPQKKLTVAPTTCGDTVSRIPPSPRGRWPANLILDEEAARMLDEESGELTSGRTPAEGSGGASRFFYTAKADAEDRDGTRHPTVKPVDLMKWLVRLVTPPRGLVLDPFMGSGPTVAAARDLGFRIIGIDKEMNYCVDAARRLRQGVLPL